MTTPTTSTFWRRRTIFDGGVIAFNNQRDLTIDTVSGQSIGLATYSPVSGLATVFTTAPTLGSSDLDEGDILVNSQGDLLINQNITAGASGNADVRLTSNGDMVQSNPGVILANELGVRQETNGDILLCEDNDVEVFAAFNNNGNIEFHDVNEFSIGEVSAQTIGNIAFIVTSGITGDDIFIISAGDVRIDFSLDAGTNDIRIIANGDVTQAAGITIIADELGVRQEAAIFNAAEDFDANARFDILLNEANDVNFFAAFNAFDGGVILFNDVDDLTISQVDAQLYCNDLFQQTTGVVTTFSGAAVAGAGDVDAGDILINVGGFLQIDHSIVAGAGNADIRLLANGDIHQLNSAPLIADELGVRQLATSLAAGNDLDANNRFDIILDSTGNDANVVAANNAFDSGTIGYSDADELIIDTVSAQSINGIVFAATDGVATTFTGAESDGGSDSDEADILINSDGSLEINQQINAGGGLADVRIQADGDITQVTSGIITANELGVIQAAAAYDANHDADANGLFEIILCAANEVDFFAAENQFANGEVQFTNDLGFTVTEITAQNIGPSFGGAAGVQSSNGDVFLQSAGFLNLVSPIIAGTANVRLVANGDIHQAATGSITASRVGFRQESNTLNATDDLDSNNRFDIILDAGNDADFIAGLNAFDGGVITFNDIDDLRIDQVTAFGVAPKTFLLTTGLTTSFSGAAVTGNGDIEDGDILISAGGFVDVDQAITAGAGNADVRITGQGDITQDIVNGIITADELGVTQTDGSFTATDDLDGNGTFDIHLCAPQRRQRFWSRQRLSWWRDQF